MMKLLSTLLGLGGARTGATMSETAPPLVAVEPRVVDDLQITKEHQVLPQLIACRAAYTLTDVRKLVEKFKDKPWKNREAIMEGQGQKIDNRDRTNFEWFNLRRAIPAKDMIKFLEENEKLLNEVNEASRKRSKVPPFKLKAPPLEMEGDLTPKKLVQAVHNKMDFSIAEVDDKHPENPVYGIAINKTAKRVTLFFRGSHTLLDWIYDGKIRYTEMKQGEVIKKFIEDSKMGSPKVHRGFESYLNKQLADPNPYNMTKFDEIVDNVKAIYKLPEYKDFGFTVTGHSLGGALAQLFGLEAASTKSFHGVVPDDLTTVITFASPQVGNHAYAQAFQHCEHLGTLRHVRVSNEGDFVAVAPFGFGYTQTGLHMFLKKEGAMEVGHRLLKNTATQVRVPWEAGPNHSLGTYLERLMMEKNRNVMEDQTIDELYKEFFEQN